MTTRGTVAWMIAVAAVTALSGCGEKVQTAGSEKRTDAKPWEGAHAAYTADGWKAGDKAAWEAHLKTRTERGQNEYPRTGSAKK